MPTRKAANSAEERRVEMRVCRGKASSVRDAFPQVAMIRIELDFVGSPNRPSPQTFLLYPSAHAFFSFACPCAECDGFFNLTSNVTELLTVRPAESVVDLSSSGQGNCQGVHRRDTGHSHPCGIEVSYRIAVELAV